MKVKHIYTSLTDAEIGEKVNKNIENTSESYKHQQKKLIEKMGIRNFYSMRKDVERRIAIESNS